MRTRPRPVDGTLDHGCQPPRRAVVEQRRLSASSPGDPPTRPDPRAQGRIERTASRVHQRAGEGAELEDLVTLLIAESGSTMDFLADLLSHCAHRARLDPTWRRSVAAVQSTMGAALVR